jgi:hypothetical protein
MSIDNRLSAERFCRTHSRRGTFETLESRLALAADLGFAGVLETLGGSTNAMYSSTLDSRGGAMVTDDIGNSYVTLQGIGDHLVDIDPGSTVSAATMESGLVKLDPDGGLLWSATFNATGGASPVIRTVAAVDADQNVYMVGDFRGTVDFDPKSGVHNVTSSQAGSEYSVYLLKLNSTGELQWVKTLDGRGLPPERLVLDDEGNLLIATYYWPGIGESMDVDPGPGQFLVSQLGPTDLLFLKYSPDGEFVWARQLGSAEATFNTIKSLAVDDQGDVFIAGAFKGTVDLNPGAGVFLASSSEAAHDAFVLRLNAAGEFVWAYVTEGEGGALFRDIEIADDGSILVGGYLSGTVDFVPGSGSLTLSKNGAGVQGLVVKLESDASVVWAHQFGGIGNTTVGEVHVDQTGNIYLGGSFGTSAQAGQTSDFDPGPDVYELFMPSTFETGYVLSLTEEGDFRWAVPIAGNQGRSQVQGISVTSAGDVHISGAFKGSGDFNPSPAGERWLNSGTSQSVFIATLTQSAPEPGAPVVNAGASQTIVVTDSVNLHGTVVDDGFPGPLTTAWSLYSGPGAVTFGNPAALDTTATFSTSGGYWLQLSATDGQFTTTDYVYILVNPATVSLTATADTYLDGGSKTTNFGTSANLLVDGNPDNGALLSWNLSGIPVGSTLQSATLSVNVTGASADTYEIYELKRSWNELQATWNKATTAVNWQSAGAQGSVDRGTTVLGTITATATGLRNVVLNAAGLAVVQGWINNPATNFGFVIQDYANTVKDDLMISSRNAAVATIRPQLELVYNPPNPPALKLRSLTAIAPVNQPSNKTTITDTAFAALAGRDSQPRAVASPKATLAQRRDAKHSTFPKFEWKAEKIAGALHSAQGSARSEHATIARDCAAEAAAFGEVGEPLTSFFHSI